MRPAGLRVVVAFAVVVAALGVGLASTSGSASAQAPPSGTITTQLQPGWNMIGWLGPDTSAGELFEAIPALNFIVAWDGGAQRYRWVWRASLGQQALPWIQGGRGLALHIGGESAVEWTRPAAGGVVLLPLRAGANLVAWGGSDGTPIEEALDWLGDAVVGASRWNSATRESERYRPGARSSANTLRTLNHGDALWVHLSEEASWWQSGTAGTEFVFVEPLHPVTESALRDEVARVLAFFHEVYGMEPLDLLVLVDPSHTAAGVAYPGEIHYSPLNLAQSEAQPHFSFAHEYFHVFQWEFRTGGARTAGFPQWLLEGTATYVEDVIERQRLSKTGDELRAHWWRFTASTLGPHRPLDDWVYEHGTRGDVSVAAGYFVGALATDWLVRRAAALSAGGRFDPLGPPELVARPDYDAHFEFFRLLPTSATWEAAFEAAFGIAVDDFYEAFEEYRIALGAQYLPHLADDHDEPLLVFVGEIPSDTRTRIRDQFETAQELFRDRFGSGPVDYTVYVAANDRLAEPIYKHVFGSGTFWLGEDVSPKGLCERSTTGFALFVILAGCPEEPLGDLLGEYHFEEALERVAPADSLTQWLPEYEHPGPYWLRFGMRGYATHAYREALGLEPLDEARRTQAQIAARAAEPLRSYSAYRSAGALRDEVAEALGFLAGDWLVARAGEPAIFDYYRLLASTDSWQEAFEAAFGITIDEFYEAFAEYRAAIGAVASPDAPEEPDAPEVVLLGELSAWEEARVLAHFEATQAFFGDRLGGDSVGYRVYVVATGPEAVAHRDVIGTIPPGACSATGRPWTTLVIVLRRCILSPVDSLGQFHFTSVLRRLAPRDAWEQWPSDYKLQGSYWLDVGLRRYADRAFLDSLGLEDLDRTRRRSANLVIWTEDTLYDLEPYQDSGRHPDRETEALSFLAADWLLARAGEPAIFEYYRLRQSTDDWQEAFEGAFGITIDDFYTAFEEYRAAGFER